MGYLILQGKKYPLRHKQVIEYVDILKAVRALENEGKTSISKDDINAQVNHKKCVSWFGLWELACIGFLVHKKKNFTNGEGRTVYEHTWRTNKRKNYTPVVFALAARQYLLKMKELNALKKDD
jgi:hypothetical protein